MTALMRNQVAITIGLLFLKAILRLSVTDWRLFKIMGSSELSLLYGYHELGIPQVKKTDGKPPVCSLT